MTAKVTTLVPANPYSPFLSPAELSAPSKAFKPVAGIDPKTGLARHALAVADLPTGNKLVSTTSAMAQIVNGLTSPDAPKGLGEPVATTAQRVKGYDYCGKGDAFLESRTVTQSSRRGGYVASNG